MAGSIFRIFDNGEGVQVAVGQDGLLITSLDGGATWVTRNSGVSVNLYGASFGVTVGDLEGFVVVGAGGTILTSADAVTWVQRASFTTADLYDVAFSGVFLAVGAGGAFGLSDDLGLTWEAKDSGTQEDLVSITADLGSYLIVGDNDTVIAGGISALNFEVLVVDGINVTEPQVESNAVMDSAVVENFEFQTEEQWVHDALGAGTTITIGGSNQFVWVDESLYASAEISSVGTFNITVEEEITIIDSMVDVAERNVWGDLLFPMFEVSGSILSGTVLSGDALFPMFKVSGRIEPGSAGDVFFPMFEVEGVISPEGIASGDILFPMFVVEGTIINASINDETEDYEVWVLNEESGHHSTYLNWQVNSMGIFNGQEIGALPDGIYSLSGEDDAGEDIEAQIMWPPSDLASVKQKSIDAVYVRMRGDVGAIRFIAIVDETKVRFFPRSMRRTPDGNYVKRIPFPKGLQGNLWQFGIENVGSGKLDLAEIEAIVLELNRRIK